MSAQGTAQKRAGKRREPKAAPLKLDSRSLYETCADVLSREIAQGVLKPGQRLASERALATTLGFTRLTVRRALQELAERGLLEPDERRGWQVCGGPVSEQRQCRSPRVERRPGASRAPCPAPRQGHRSPCAQACCHCAR